jgi:hypothetical protein
MKKWAWVCVFVLLASTASEAQVQRQLPAKGQLGATAAERHPFPLVQIGDEVLRLAPGALVFDEHNRTILHALIPISAPVLLVRDMNGHVSRLYVLRPDELARLEHTAGQ